MEAPETPRESFGWGWKVRGRLEQDPRTGDLVLFIAGPDDLDRSGVIDIDPLGRVRVGTISRSVDAVSVPSGPGDDASIATVLRTALEVTVDSVSMRAPLRSVLALLGPETSVSASGRRLFAARHTASPRLRERAGDVEPTFGSVEPGADAVWRGPADDAVVWVDRQVLHYANAVVQILSVEESVLWLHALGQPSADLARQTGVPVATVHDLVRNMRATGLLDSEAWWRVRDDVVWVRRGADLVFASRMGQAALPLAFGGWGAVIWTFLDGRRSATLTQILDHLRNDHRVDEDVRSDVTGLLNGLLAAGLISC